MHVWSGKQQQKQQQQMVGMFRVLHFRQVGNGPVG